jgi:general secretion pathway protein E/type IV pilus assembly protein PilB
MGAKVKHKTPSVELLQNLSSEQAWHYMIVPKTIDGNHITFFSSESEENLKDELEMVLGLTVSIERISSTELKSLLSRYYRKNHQSETKKLDYSGNNNFLENLISEAKSLDSSDIHIESYEKRSRVRLRIDGKLMERYVIDKSEYPALVNKIKVMASLDIAEKRLPQDGRIYFEKGNLKFDIRVSVLPTLYGEKIVLRLLNKDATNVDIKTLGIEGRDLANFMEAIRKPNGIILISGPTGSGKTTTLYATLKQLNDESRNITTIEDPIEYTLEGINQVQLKENIGLDFASAMRTFLRQDPDVIMV